MALVKRVSESEVLVRNSAFKWTLAWVLFFILLLTPAIFCLAESQRQTAQGGEIVPVWVGVVLLLFALLSCSMMLPFTVVTTTRMDKSGDIFVQDHGLLNCLPCSCIPTVKFPLSEIERIEVENFDGPEFHGIGADDSSDSSSEDDEDLDPAERAQDEEDRKHFRLQYVKPRAQVVVHTKYDSVPITAVTSGLPSLLPFRNERMTAQQIKSVLDRFLGLAVVNEDENAEEDSGNQVDLFSAAWDTSAAGVRTSDPEEAQEKRAPTSPARDGGPAASSKQYQGDPDAAESKTSGNQVSPFQGGVRMDTIAAPGGEIEDGRDSQMRHAPESQVRTQDAAGKHREPEAETADVRSAAALSAGWASADAETPHAGDERAAEMEVDEGMLDFVSIPPHMRPTRTTGYKLVTNPVGRPVPAEVQERAVPHEEHQAKPSPAAGPFGPSSKLEVEDRTSAPDKVHTKRADSWKRLPAQPYLDETGKGRKYPAKKKGETEEERKLRRALKKQAKKNETPEERAERKAAKNAKKLRKAQRKSGQSKISVPGGAGSLTEVTGEGASDGDDSSD